MFLSPPGLTLLENDPNPFRTVTRIAFELSAPAEATLQVYDVSGRLVATPLADKQLPAGGHRVEFDSGRLGSGVYLCRLSAQNAHGQTVVTRKMLIVR